MASSSEQRILDSVYLEQIWTRSGFSEAVEVLTVEVSMHTKNLTDITAASANISQGYF